MSIRRLLAAIVVCTGMVVLSHSAASAQGSPLFAVLLGGNEVSGGGDANAGDTTAFGPATVIFRGTNTICWAILVAGLDTPTAAHIHGAKAGLNGAIRVTLVAPMNAADTFLANIRNIQASPTSFYINVHSVLFPGGGLRGQLY